MRWVLPLGGLGAGLLVVVGLVASPMPPATGWASIHLVRVWRHHHVVPVALVLSWLAIGLLTAAWLALGLLVRRRVIGLAGVRLALVVWSVPLLVLPPLFSGDGWSYAADSYLTGHGLSPYRFTPSALHGEIVSAVARKWLHTPAPYGPIPMLSGGLAAHVTTSAWWLMFASRFLALVGIGLLGYALPRLSAMAGAAPAVGAWLVLPSPMLVIYGVGGLHYDVLMAGLIAVALVLARRHWAAAAVVAGLAAAVKPPGLLVCIGIVLLTLPAGVGLARRVTRTAAVAATAVGTALLVGFAGGFGLDWLKALRVPLHLRSPFTITYVAAEQLHRFHHVHWPLGSAAALTHAVGLAVTLAVAVVALLRTRTGDARIAFVATGVVALVLILLGPEIQFWYALWCLPLFAVARPGVRLTRVLVAVVIALGVVAPLDLVRFHWWAFPLAMAVVVVAAVAALPWPVRTPIRLRAPA